MPLGHLSLQLRLLPKDHLNRLHHLHRFSHLHRLLPKDKLKQQSGTEDRTFYPL